MILARLVFQSEVQALERADVLLVADIRSA